jgi:hypothetical protein
MYKFLSLIQKSNLRGAKIARLTLNYTALTSNLKIKKAVLQQ